MDTELAKRALSRALRQSGCTYQMASKLVLGQVMPSIERAVKIEREVGIPPSAWVDKTALQEMWKIIIRDKA